MPLPGTELLLFSKWVVAKVLFFFTIRIFRHACTKKEQKFASDLLSLSVFFRHVTLRKQKTGVSLNYI